MTIDTRLHMSEDFRRARNHGKLVVVRLRMDDQTRECWWEVEVYSAINAVRSYRQNIPAGKGNTRKRICRKAAWLAEQICERCKDNLLDPAIVYKEAGDAYDEIVRTSPKQFSVLNPTVFK